MKARILTIFMVLAAFASMGATCGGEVDDRECDGDFDCASWQECSGGMCLEKPEQPEEPKDPSGTVVTGCTCATPPPGAAPGQTRPNDSCESGYDVFVLCNGCCPDPYNCYGSPWGRVCQ